MIDADIEDFFGSVSHAKLMGMLKEQIVDPRILSLIARILRAGYLENGNLQPSLHGTPQGGPKSPCLANVYLHHTVDLQMQALNLAKPESERKKRRARITAKVREIHDKSRKSYGSPRVHAALSQAGERPYVDVIGTDVPFFIVERYDRSVAENGVQRLHQIDFCQAQGFLSEEKYEEDGGPSLKDNYHCLMNISSQGIGVYANVFILYHSNAF